MPKRRRTQSARGRTPVKRRRTFLKARRRRLTRGPATRRTVRRSRPMGQKFRFKGRYATTLDTGSLTTPYSYVFSANGLYDPDITGAGHQCYGFDQMMTFYDHYTVIASKLTVVFNNKSNTNIAVGIGLRDNSTSYSSLTEFIEAGGTVFANLSEVQGGSNQKTLSLGCNVSRFLGRPNIMSEDDLRGDVSNNPSEQAYFQIYIFSLDGTSTFRVDCHVVEEFVAILTEPKVLPIS